MEFYLTHNNYIGECTYSNEDKIYYGKLIMIGGDLVTFEADTFKELEKEFIEAIYDYEETLTSLKRTK